MFRKYTIALLLAVALSIAPRAFGALHTEHWRPYLLVETSIGVAVATDTKQPDGYSSDAECEARLTEMAESMLANNPELKVMGKCSTNDPETEVTEIQKALGATPGKDI
jgi:hypothetical protein